MRGLVNQLSKLPNCNRRVVDRLVVSRNNVRLMTMSERLHTFTNVKFKVRLVLKLRVRPFVDITLIINNYIENKMFN